MNDDFISQFHYDFSSVTLLSIYYYYNKNYYFLLLNFILYVYILFIRSKYIFLIIYVLNNNLKKLNNLIKKILLDSCKYLSRDNEDKNLQVNENNFKNNLINKQKKIYFKNNCFHR